MSNTTQELLLKIKVQKAIAEYIIATKTKDHLVVEASTFHLNKKLGQIKVKITKEKQLKQ